MKEIHNSLETIINIDPDSIDLNQLNAVKTVSIIYYREHCLHNCW